MWSGPGWSNPRWPRVPVPRLSRDERRISRWVAKDSRAPPTAPGEISDFGLDSALLTSVNVRMPVAYRISRAAQSDGVVFTLSGVLDGEHATRLEELLALEGTAGVVLDLKDVTLVDGAAVRFLALVEAAGAV